MKIPIRFIVAITLLWLSPTALAQANPPDAKPATSGGGAQVVSANGFTCSKVGSGVTCQGAFRNLDKKMKISASGQNQVQLSVEKKSKKYTYTSDTGCLCEGSKSSNKCTNNSGKTKTFRGGKMVQESKAFCGEK